MYSSRKTNMKTFPVFLVALGTLAKGERRVTSAWEWEMPQPVRNQQAKSFEHGIR